MAEVGNTVNHAWWWYPTQTAPGTCSCIQGPLLDPPDDTQRYVDLEPTGCVGV